LKRPSEINSKIKVSDQELRNYIYELEKENLRLQKQIAKLQVKNVSQQNQIAALNKAKPKQVVQIVSFADIDDKIKK
jgi:hypothetical protein